MGNKILIDFIVVPSRKTSATRREKGLGFLLGLRKGQTEVGSSNLESKDSIL